MESSYFELALKERRIGFMVFDANLVLTHRHLKYTNYFPQERVLKYQTSVWDLIPELVGQEEIIQLLLQGKRKRHVLERLNRVTPSGKLEYYDLVFMPVKPRGASANHLLCLVNDVTAATAMEQTVRQKDYELRLVQAQLLNRNDFLSDSLLGNSERVQEVREFIGKVAVYNTTVLLQGESGTGKSLVAKLLHNSSSNPRGPFVEINCAAIPATLLESELFGYEKGAFTNALMSKRGLLEEADGGTLFLDEIGDMPQSLQAKLLTFLETRRFRRLGSTREQSVDIRLIAATNKDLQAAIRQGEFRQDLFFRINVVSITLPPLRELGDDVLVLANHFISVLRFDLKKKITGLTPAAQSKLKAYSWPGNVRELRNVIERAMLFAAGERIDAGDIVLYEEPEMGAGGEERFSLDIPDGGLSLEDVERDLLRRSLQKTHGNQSRAAQLLGLSLDTFRYRLKKFGLSPQSFR
ncbi:sigma-54-dependent Fis family transcriptional regulator [Candidatus Parcubacteria bacterium]|nr:MAG: sigma-54-dependent Fis family transcriptional regulator [Candidatus Parcubacteria bacterium]